MKNVYIVILLIINVNGQERLVGTVVSADDRATWKKIEMPNDVCENEIVAVYSPPHKEWLYGQARGAPGFNFSGIANCVKDGPYYNSFAVNFKKNVRKLISEVDADKTRKTENS